MTDILEKIGVVKCLLQESLREDGHSPIISKALQATEKIQVMVIDERTKLLKELEELEEIEWDNRNNQAALTYQRVQELIKERAEVAKP